MFLPTNWLFWDSLYLRLASHNQCSKRWPWTSGLPASLRAPKRTVIHLHKNMPRAVNFVSTESVVKSMTSITFPSQGETIKNSKTVLLTSTIVWLHTATPRATSQVLRPIVRCVHLQVTQKHPVSGVWKPPSGINNSSPTLLPQAKSVKDTSVGQSSTKTSCQSLQVPNTRWRNCLLFF